MREYHTGHIVVAFLGGAAAGAAVTALTAPQSGPRTRRQIAGTFDRNRRQIAGTFERNRERANRLPGAVEHASEAAREAFTEALDGRR